MSLTRSTAEFISHHTTLNSMKELQHQINLSIHDIKTKAFQLGSYRDPDTTLLESIYLSCNTHGLVPSIAEDETSKIKLHDCYILLGKDEFSFVLLVTRKYPLCGYFLECIQSAFFTNKSLKAVVAEWL